MYNVLLDDHRLIRSHANQLRKRYENCEQSEDSNIFIDTFELYDGDGLSLPVQQTITEEERVPTPQNVQRDQPIHSPQNVEMNQSAQSPQIVQMAQPIHSPPEEFHTPQHNQHEPELRRSNRERRQPDFDQGRYWQRR